MWNLEKMNQQLKQKETHREQTEGNGLGSSAEKRKLIKKHKLPVTK